LRVARLDLEILRHHRRDGGADIHRPSRFETRVPSSLSAPPVPRAGRPSVSGGKPVEQCHGQEREEDTARPDAEMPLAVQFVLRPEIDETVEGLAVDQRLEATADMDIGRGFAARSIEHEAERVLRPGNRLLAKIGDEGEDLLTPLALCPQVHRHEGRVIDGDANLLAGGDEEIPIPLALQDRGEKLDKGGSADRRAEIVPRAVAGDADVEIAAEGRVPEMHRRRTPTPGHPYD